jgi:hypothetical protein
MGFDQMCDDLSIPARHIDVTFRHTHTLSLLSSLFSFHQRTTTHSLTHILPPHATTTTAQHPTTHEKQLPSLYHGHTETAK